jgi:hypothetical protein
MLAGKALHCDCGYEVRALDEDAFVEAIRRHASEAHGIEFSLALARHIANGALELSGNGATGKEEQ